jgi:hypothetical protein
MSPASRVGGSCEEARLYSTRTKLMMAHLIEPDEVGRLASLAGLARLDEWGRQRENLDARIDSQLCGNVQQAWNACLPTWLELGRVSDLSRAVRVPRYWPTYARELGLAFADRFEKEWRFILGILRSMPVESHEYLCACDLLRMMTCHFEFDDQAALEEIFALDCPLPSVLQVEYECVDRFRDARTVGAFIRQAWLEECGDDSDG